MRITFVIPWFGREPGGGAETLCHAFCVRLAEAGHDVEVLTTRCRDHDADWNTDHLPGGRSLEEPGFAVERFGVDRGDRRRFGALNERLMRGETLTYREEREFLDSSINSSALVRTAAERAAGRAVIVLPYLFGLTHAVVHALEGRAIVWPCLHDEGYARMKLVADMIGRCRAVVFNSRGEMELARAMGLPVRTGAIVGMGVDLPPDQMVAETSQPDGQPHYLYLGRRAVGKGFHELLRLFAMYRSAGGRSELRVAGKGDPVPVGEEGVRDLGFLPAASKWEALRGARALIMPSTLESFSIALLEALAVGTPGVVNGRCAVTTAHVTDGRCGLPYGAGTEFVEILRTLDERPELRASLGANGRRYVADHHAWPGRLEALTGMLREAAPHAC